MTSLRDTLNKRHRTERRFRMAGKLSMLSGLFALVVLLSYILIQGAGGFFRYEVALMVDTNHPALEKRQYRKVINVALYETLRLEDRRLRLQARQLLSRAAPDVLEEHLSRGDASSPSKQQIWLPLSPLGEGVLTETYDATLPEEERPIKDSHIRWLSALEEQGMVRHAFNSDFFTQGASSAPERAGVGIALLGSFLMMLIVASISLPLGVASAIYLEEFAPRKSRWVRLIELNINNLAAVPSIVFGILGLAIFINTFGLPRSSPLVGGLVLTLMTLPTIIIATRAVLQAVPSSIKWAAYGLGASKQQALFHHVLPIASPGIITGAIIGLAQALGETAPLLIIGMVAFVADYPQTITEPASALPVQTFIWAGSPDPAFATRTAASIVVLLFFLIAMNAIAVYLRHRFEKRGLL
ncbi:MAG: phosphate ABC transporter permease PstA [Alphaproteobacteria bacterium GM202ARS2]|nr:phosphate ABC transporter permease PstA [Alphaproteobacteria bacterium GM202ARS2]